MPDASPITVALDAVKSGISDVRASINILFAAAGKDGRGIIDIYRREFIEHYMRTLQKIQEDLDALKSDAASASRRHTVIDDEPDSVDCINGLIWFCDGKALVSSLENCILDALTAHDIFNYYQEADSASGKEKQFLVLHAERVCRSAGIVLAYIQQLEQMDGDRNALSRICPEAFSLFKEKSIIKLAKGRISGKTLEMLAARARAADPFISSRSFRYLDGQFYPAELSDIRKVDQFFGYNEVRRIFHEHFSAFSSGEANYPLLVSSLPGLGKTHFSIAYALSFDNLTLILPEPAELEKGLEPLTRKLAVRKDHKFVIFFDDIDPAKTNWYYFRTNVGGSFTLPPNVNIVIAANYDFPANISSRGRGVKFPMFDEIRCQEMVMDFLVSMGMTHTPNDLVSVISADYVEEFGQKKFEELSPRTLIRYLEIYKRDPKKRKRMLDLSRAELISRPDAQAFYDFNVKIMKMLYGEEALSVLREEKLKQSMIT
ncbi:MAG: hypothetical protein WCV67_06965 [Victivallaceae bacterium]